MTASAPAATRPPITYARARLWLGITSVGTLVVLTATALLLGLPAQWLASGSQSLTVTVAGVAAALVGVVLVGAPFDWLGGYYLPRRFGRRTPSLARWVSRWLRGVSAQLVVLLLAATAIAGAAQAGGDVAALGVVAGLLVLATLLQLPLARFVAGWAPGRLIDDLRRDAGGQRVIAVDVPDEGSVGGIVGLPGSTRIVIPYRWLTDLPPALLAAQLQRRDAALRSGSRTRGVLVALGWNVLGFAAALVLPGSDPATAAGLVNVMLWVTLWSFGGLLLLPTISRGGVYEVDQAARAAGVDAATFSELVRQQDAWQDDEPTRPPGIEGIFHPVPAAEHRIERVADDTPVAGAWHAARVALPLSWVTLGLLGRAVHCNCGRPDLWVLLPGD